MDGDHTRRSLAVLEDGSPAPDPDEGLYVPQCFRDSSELRRSGLQAGWEAGKQPVRPAVSPRYPRRWWGLMRVSAAADEEAEKVASITTVAIDTCNDTRG